MMRMDSDQSNHVMGTKLIPLDYRKLIDKTSCEVNGNYPSAVSFSWTKIGGNFLDTTGRFFSRCQASMSSLTPRTNYVL
jgi:hypothetical protein